MRTAFSTDGIPLRHRFKLCQERNRELFGRSNMRQVTHEPFDARSMSNLVGPLSLSNLETSPVTNDILSRERKSTVHAGDTFVNIVSSGKILNNQLDLSTVLNPGDFCVSDNHYDRSCSYPSRSKLLAITVPRSALEGLLGPSRLYVGLAMDASLPGAALLQTFMVELARVHNRLSSEMADRMSRIAIDLIVASIAERMARDTPKPLLDTVLVQRAKAYVEAHFGDPALDPPQLAVAMTVSLRRLQQLFHERGRHISDWIWERRLENAFQRLADPMYRHLSIGLVAYGCGFTSQAHFSKRFKDRFSISPRDYRRTS